MRLVNLAVSSLNQWAMSFDHNLSNIKQSIAVARESGAAFRVGPELELTGYGCEDHFLERETCITAWECLAEILSSGLTDGIVCDIGLPVLHEGVLYNCRVFCLDGEILLVRPKKFMANDGNYRELRWFSSWKRHKVVTSLNLPECVQAIKSQRTVPFGDAYLSFQDTDLASECCEELFTPKQASSGLALHGVQIISNGSGSHHQLRKQRTRLRLMKNVTERCGGVYLYANQQGCDGGRLYYDGCASVVMNGEVILQGRQFSLHDVDVCTVCLDLDEVVNFRASKSSFREQASERRSMACVNVAASLCELSSSRSLRISRPLKATRFLPEQEIALGPACWLWDYLRRSGASGYLLPLSGGADSSAVAAIVGSMCQLVIKAIHENDKRVLTDARRIGNYKPGEEPADSQEFASRIFYTVYMASQNSSTDTQSRAQQLAREIGSNHWNLKIDIVVNALISLFCGLTGRIPRYKVDSGTPVENLALQNLQARVRMVISYMLASLLPWVGRKKGFLLVLGSSNADESIRGYMTKYDCSSADINPIGGISKRDLRAFLRWGAQKLGFPVLAQVEAAPPTAELEPSSDGYKQTDEEDMGMTYDELNSFSRLRKVDRLGPVAMFQRLCQEWNGLHHKQVANKVKDFFRYYSINRHKMTTLTPSYHAESYSPDDNRFDQRQFLYDSSWSRQFMKIDELVAKMKNETPL
ncbi:hypothetical protein SELMODRAFT_95570 [Selaginella moellendorffii]|uniref:Glutamine-dependent NAD(+) synthetase n=1 Tax=Selaginella moellendorffii TaxID=88036 RepID=D8RL09_SELML|nr:glutamine-dependent NAD(+) synthetase [Selaginella moellendorffii]EFJ27546.1 hypothetical protein SELMODRAFT_95570 [Selaginella moellendorffii]|eukprot:XP_002971797.1 glutamine-dependent NAD(+) synthetase [Selaginella moellendorffii]